MALPRGFHEPWGLRVLTGPSSVLDVMSHCPIGEVACPHLALEVLAQVHTHRVPPGWVHDPTHDTCHTHCELRGQGQ